MKRAIYAIAGLFLLAAVCVPDESKTAAKPIFQHTVRHYDTADLYAEWLFNFAQHYTWPQYHAIKRPLDATVTAP